MQIIYFIVLLLLLVMVVYTSIVYERFDPSVSWKEKIEDVFFLIVGRHIDMVHSHYYTLKTNNSSMRKMHRFINDDLKKYHNESVAGKQWIHDKSIIIAGLIQNESFYIPFLKMRCHEMTKDFRDYKILIVENNSTDNTRDLLIEWSAEDPNVVILCQDPFITNALECDIQHIFPVNEMNNHSPMPTRIQRMAFLRNVYMTHIRHYYPYYDFLCVMDMDLHGDLYMDGFFHSFYLLKQNKNIDAITCNGVLATDSENYYYYDSFAYIEENESIIWENTNDKSVHDNYVHTNITNRYSSQMIPDKVRSAFGGAALYRISSIINHSYDFSPIYYSCEHSYFNNNLNIRVNPRFIFNITHNS